MRPAARPVASDEHAEEGIATQALGQFLVCETTRPLFAHAAADNAGSIRVLEKIGMRPDGEVTFCGDRAQRWVVESI